MLLQNSYIFLPKSVKKNNTMKKNEDGIITIEVTPSVFSLLKEKLNFSSDEIIRDGYFKRTINTTIKIDSISYYIEISINEVVKNIFLDIIVNHKSKAQAIKCLEFINDILTNKDIEQHYITIVSYDAVSEYYCNKIYPKLNELERLLRQLLFNIYIVNFGRTYYSKTIKPELQRKVKSVIQAKGNEEKKEIERLKNFFYSLEYIDIQTLLFEEKWTTLDEQWKTDFLRKHNDLSELEDKQLREGIENLSPKSDWDRFFADKIAISNITDLIEDIRKSRNKIAHCKFFYRSEYQVCLKSLSKLKKSILEAIKLTEEKDFVQKNQEYLGQVWGNLLNTINHIHMEFTASIAPVVQNIVKVSQSMKPAFERLGKFINKNLYEHNEE